ncbi:hypothetical protein ASD45_09730 [Pseudolabrys sp. Root1462]|uniref:hypothetical protein n=1 Tax=Pseudolabrys sp. Root1462 TaxID=1736466 RepID=UPI000702FC63|nr:hypothetical protein [Pseudolabrys sp. Root1462]KQZ01108.1 hypothetical protein ASD45_09730 [Pseudolabrys sp. Root1462]
MAKKTDDHKKFWDDIAKPDYEDFMKNKGDIRKAFHAVTSANHMADWVYQSNRSYFDTFTFTDKNGQQQPVNSNSTFANYVREQISDFEILRGISNASKHLNVKKAQNDDAPTSAANTYVTAATYDSEAFDSTAFDAGAVMQEGASGDFPLDEKITSVMEFWPEFCKQHGIPIE